jgi:hypothetical protein
MTFREKGQVLDEFWLKFFAIVFMTFDHVGYFMQQSGFAATEGTVNYGIALAFRVVGRLAFPLFALMLAEGLHKTHDRANYLFRIALVWAGILIVEVVLVQTGLYASSALPPQAFTDLLLFGLFIYFLEKKGWWKALALVPLAYILVSYAAGVSENYASFNNLTSVWSSYFPYYLRSDYSLMGFLMFLGFYYASPLAERLLKIMAGASGADLAAAKKEKSYQSLLNSLYLTGLVLATVLFWAVYRFAPLFDVYSDTSDSWIQSYCILAGIWIFLYNGKRGYDAKWFRYAEYGYYPVHIALIALIFGLIS